MSILFHFLVLVSFPSLTQFFLNVQDGQTPFHKFTLFVALLFSVAYTFM